MVRRSNSRMSGREEGLRCARCPSRFFSCGCFEYACAGMCLCSGLALTHRHTLPLRHVTGVDASSVRAEISVALLVMEGVSPSPPPASYPYTYSCPVLRLRGRPLQALMQKRRRDPSVFALTARGGQGLGPRRCPRSCAIDPAGLGLQFVNANCLRCGGSSFPLNVVSCLCRQACMSSAGGVVVQMLSAGCCGRLLRCLYGRSFQRELERSDCRGVCEAHEIRDHRIPDIPVILLE